MTRSLLSSDAVRPTSELVVVSALLEPSSALDARIRQLAHATLSAERAAPRIPRWERACNAALATSYAAYVVSQVFRIFLRSRG